MKTDRNSLVGKSENFEKEVFEALKGSGFHLRKSDEEVREIVEKIGETKIEVPESLSDADRLYDMLSKKVWGNHPKENEEEFFAIAAHGQKGSTLPKEILDKMRKDISDGKKIKGKLKKHGGRSKT